MNPDDLVYLEACMTAADNIRQLPNGAYLSGAIAAQWLLSMAICGLAGGAIVWWRMTGQTRRSR